MEIIGIYITLAGIWLSGAGIFGEDKLKAFEARFGRFLSDLIHDAPKPIGKMFDWSKQGQDFAERIRSKKAGESFSKSMSTIWKAFGFILIASVLAVIARQISKELESIVIVVATLGFLIFLVVWAINFLVFILLVVWNILVFFFGAILFLLGVAAVVVTALSCALIWVVSIPYVVFDKLVGIAKMKSTVIAMGILLSTIGVIWSPIGRSLRQIFE